MNVQTAMTSRGVLGKPNALASASRYELERIAQVLWQEIMAKDSVEEKIVAAYKALQIELKLRQRT